MSEKPLKVYISWSRTSQDDKLAFQLQKHLTLLERRGLIDIWDEIVAGINVDKEEERRIEQSDIILLLISVDFFNDEECIEDLKMALKRYEEGESIFVIPVMLRNTFLESTVLSKLKIQPSEKYPVVHKHWENVDEAFMRVIDEVVKVVKFVRRKGKVKTEEVIKDKTLNIVNPSLKDYKDVVEVMNVHSIKPGGGGEHIEDDSKKEQLIDNFLDKSKTLDNIIVEDVEFSRADLLLKKAILLHKSSIRNDNFAKLEEAYQLLEQAIKLEPKNIEILLEMAKVLVILTPDDPTDEEAILEHIEMMVHDPQDEETSFYLAQARMMLAASNLDHIDEELLKKAQLTFRTLGHEHLVADCDGLLELAMAKRKAKIPDLPKRPPQMSKPSGPPPLPKNQPFHPVGKWTVDIHSLIPNKMSLDLYPNGTLSGKQLYIPFNGNWSFQNSYLYIQGYMSGFPFQYSVQVQYEKDGQYYAMGVDGNRYVFTRVEETTTQGNYF